jgi:hypothetical protein
MSFAKSVPEGLKLLECERGIGGKNSPECEQGVGGKNSHIRYIPEKDPVQEVLEKNKMINYFKLMLPHMDSKRKVAIWASGTPQ